MPIHVSKITKRYGSQLAVDHVSFHIETGEIVGFIGPNGAGKSTTMKVITGTIPPDEGQVLVSGLPVIENQLAVKRMLGYLPEHNPLYDDMYIREFLQHVAGFYGIRGRKAKEKIKEVIRLTGLEPEARKKIGFLSKGFRQRVGLAQALIHDPDILVLDEPTSGLDPNQIIQIRNLISRIGREKTVLLSTHILQEVEAICDRVLIIHQGKLAADEKPGRLGTAGQGKATTILLEVDQPAESVLWTRIPGIRHAEALENNQFLLETDEERDMRADVSRFAVEQGLTVLSLALKRKSLEEVFREITGS